MTAQFNGDSSYTVEHRYTPFFDKDVLCDDQPGTIAFTHKP